MTYSEYEVPFNAKPLCTPHKIRMICIGAGLAGMTLAYKIIHEKKLEDVIDFTIYERQVFLCHSTSSPGILTLAEWCWWHLAGESISRLDM